MQYLTFMDDEEDEDVLHVKVLLDLEELIKS